LLAKLWLFGLARAENDVEGKRNISSIQCKNRHWFWTCCWITYARYSWRCYYERRWLYEVENQMHKLKVLAVYTRREPDG